MDQHIDNIVTGYIVDELTNNRAFSAFAYDVPLAIPRFPLKVFLYELRALRELLNRSPFNDHQTATQPCTTGRTSFGNGMLTGENNGNKIERNDGRDNVGGDDGNGSDGSVMEIFCDGDSCGNGGNGGNGCS